MNTYECMQTLTLWVSSLDISRLERTP